MCILHCAYKNEKRVSKRDSLVSLSTWLLQRSFGGPVKVVSR